MSVDRQFGVHELPGTEQPAPAAVKRDTVSAGFELQVRGYVNEIWARLAELDGRIDDFQAWRAEVALFLKASTGIDPRVRPGDRVSPAPGKRGRKPGPRPWLAEGVSRRTYFRRKEKE